MGKRWVEFSMQVVPEAVEAVAELFGRWSAEGVAIEEAITPTYEEPGFVRHPEALVTVRGFVPQDEATPGVLDELRQATWYLNRIWPVGELVTRDVDDDDWATAWKQYYSVFRIGRRCVIKPEWLEYAPEPGDVVIELDPGMAFGTGQHPTTATCLELLEDVVQPGARVLDVGCGSGILAIGALGLGAAEAVLLDTDAQAVKSSLENLERNGLLAKARVLEGSLPSEAAPAGAWDVVVANIIASAIIALAPQLRDALAPGGRLVVSGIIASRAEDVEAALAGAGLVLERTLAPGDWRTYLLRAS